MALGVIMVHIALGEKMLRDGFVLSKSSRSIFSFFREEITIKKTVSS